MKKTNLLILTFVVLALLGFFSVASRFGGGENVESEKPRVVCKNQNQCFWTAHVHATIKIFQGGKEIALSFEQGKLEEEHTHADKDKLHWHGLIPVDQNKEVKDWSVLEVGKIPEDLGLNIEGEPKFIINGQEVNKKYVWSDGDEIEIKY